MISGFWRPLSDSSNHLPSISRNALRWLLISTIFYSSFLAAKRLLKRTNRVSTDVADKHARYISEITLLSPAKSRRSRMNWAIMAHIVASITVFVNAPPLYLPREFTPLQTQGLPRCRAPLPREWRPTGHVFLASSCLTPNRGCSI